MHLRVVLTVLCVVRFAAGQVCPSEMVPATPSVCIDRYEWPGSLGQRPALAVSGLPEADGSAIDAEGACLVRGMRICQLDEWVAACRGPGGSRYPYGDRYDAEACNTSKRWRVFDTQKVHKRDLLELQRLDQSVASGSFPRCVSAAGAYDMIGNAEEWVKCDEGKFGWCLVGGFWARPQTCTEAIVIHSPHWHLYETGFRCCKDMV